MSGFHDDFLASNDINIDYFTYNVLYIELDYTIMQLKAFCYILAEMTNISDLT